MFSHDAMRALYGKFAFTFHLGTQTNVPTTTTNVGSFIVPWNCVLKAVGVSVLSGDAAGSSITAQVKRSTTVLVSSGATTAGTAAAAAQTPVASEVNAPLSRGEQILIAVLAANATDDFTGASITVIVEPMKQDGDV